MEDLHFLISKLTIELQQSKQCSICIRINIYINGTELRVQKQFFTFLVNLFSTKDEIQFDGGKNSLFNNDDLHSLQKSMEYFPQIIICWTKNK